MNLLDTTISNKLLDEIKETLDPINQHIISIEFPRLIAEILQNRKAHSQSLLPVLIWKNNYDQQFKNNIQKIKIKYYKRNLALLEILSEKQNTHISLVFKIIRENLKLEHIPEHTDIYQWYRTYRTEQVILHPQEHFLLYEPNTLEPLIE